MSRAFLTLSTDSLYAGFGEECGRSTLPAGFQPESNGTTKLEGQERRV